MAIIYELVRNHICEYHQTTCARVNKGVEKEGHLEVGDVMLRQVHESAKGRNKKLFCAYGGTPHIVVKKQSPTTVQIQNMENDKMVPSAANVKTLRRFYGREDTLPTPTIISQEQNTRIVDVIDHRVNNGDEYEYKVQYTARDR